MIDKERLEAHLNNGEREYVMAAAIYIDDEKTYQYKPFNINTGYVVSGWRHHCIWEIFGRETVEKYMKSKWEDGFITNKNRFLNRKEALELVIKNGQLTKPLLGGRLTSEDLW